LNEAGADAHIDGPMAGWVTGEQPQRRDRTVFKTAATIGLPVAWNLADGYQRDEAGGTRRCWRSAGARRSRVRRRVLPLTMGIPCPGGSLAS
jgi:hypothetical protein